MTNENIKKIEYGDFQTPRDLARQVCILLKKQNYTPKSVIEPTCGIGSFFLEALDSFSSIQIGHAFDIEKEYVETLKNELAKEKKSISHKIEIANFFVKDWETELNRLPEPILVIGNPPWVTNSQLGQLQSKNLPKKYNFKKMKRKRY